MRYMVPILTIPVIAIFFMLYSMHCSSFKGGVGFGAFYCFGGVFTPSNNKKRASYLFMIVE